MTYFAATVDYPRGLKIDSHTNITSWQLVMFVSLDSNINFSNNYMYDTTHKKVFIGAISVGADVIIEQMLSPISDLKCKKATGAFDCLCFSS